MTVVWDSGRYEAGALLVLLAMADYADEQHVCYPSISVLARKARLSERQIIRILNTLKIDGTITPVGDHRVKSGRPIVVYRINVEALKGDTMSPLGSLKGDMVSPLGSLKGDMVSPLAASKGDICALKGDIAMSYDPPMIHQSDQRDDTDFQNGGEEDGNSLPAAIVAAWQWPLTAQARAFLRNAIAGFSEDETLRAIEIAAAQPHVERPAAYVKRVLQSRMSALVDTAPMPTPLPAITPRAELLPHDVALVRSALAEALPTLADSASAWPIRIEQDAVTVAAGHRAEWVSRIAERLTNTVAVYLRRPITLTITESL